MAIIANLICLVILGYLAWYLINACDSNYLNHTPENRKPENRGENDSSSQQQKTQHNG